MEIKYNFKNFDPSDHLKKYAHTRFDKVGKYMKHAENAELTVNLEVEKHRHIAEVVLHADNLHISANEESGDMYATIDMLLDKVEAQVRKIRGKGMAKAKKRAVKNKTVRLDIVSFAPMPSGGGRIPTVVEADRYEPKPMPVDEAAMQLESLNYEFLVFLNAETERINVIYRRKDGDYGLIDPGV
ncbi:MAG: ribosome-associated translation inhibitor RaiA [Deltaproteobacteria bacterium]|nr:ribosome-associated translation inhibitor RaiA [Deltaproteobacteria bacterium]